MQFASKPTRFDEPGECIVIPGRTYDENGGVLLDGTYDGRNGDIHLWLSYAGAHAMARQVPKLDLVERADLERAQEANAQLAAELDQARAERDELRGKLDRINGLAADGFRVERQRGPAPRRQAVKK